MTLFWIIVPSFYLVATLFTGRAIGTKWALTNRQLIAERKRKSNDRGFPAIGYFDDAPLDPDDSMEAIPIALTSIFLGLFWPFILLGIGARGFAFSGYRKRIAKEKEEIAEKVKREEYVKYIRNELLTEQARMKSNDRFEVAQATNMVKMYRDLLESLGKL